MQGTLVLEKILTKHGVVHFKIMPKKEGELVNGSHGKDMIKYLQEIKKVSNKKLGVLNYFSSFILNTESRGIVDVVKEGTKWQTYT